MPKYKVNDHHNIDQINENEESGTDRMIELENVDDKRRRFQVNKVSSINENDDVNLTEESKQDDETSPLNYDTYNSDTKYAKSFRHFTREALPRLDNYRNILSIQAQYRPTLDELHHPSLAGKQLNGHANDKRDKITAEIVGQVKFGWIKGVFVRCLLNIWGVMLFLRLTWVVAQTGILEGILLIMTASVVTTITALSMSAISTNGVIKGGGTYYMISRSLGPEFGGSIGLIFSLANAVACAMYVVGFCESLQSLLTSFSIEIVDGGIQDVRIIGSVTVIILLMIVVIGMEWEAKAQMGLLVILLAAIFNFFIGTLVGPKDDESRAKGFLGYNVTLLKNNLYSDYREFEGVNHNFFSVFSIFFPAATGILAGANISGDLKDPQKSIPKGTILAIVITTLSYIGIGLVAACTVSRDATGSLADFYNDTFLNCNNSLCKYGLQNDFHVMELVSISGSLIYAGCFAATLSSALASLVSAPKIFQALCQDKLYPKIEWFGRGYGPNNEPVRGYILTFFIAVAFILIGELNAIAPLISNFFLAAYTLINFSTFHASLAKPIGWRPTFKYYNMWLSLIGSILCVAVMFLISWWTALLTLLTVMALYLIVSYRKPDVNWGSTTQAQMYTSALNTVHQLNNIAEHVKNYRPQILVLSGMPSSRKPLIDFANLLTKNLSLLLCAHIHQNSVSYRIRNVLNYKANSWLKAHKIKSFYSFIDNASFDEGAGALMQASGIGKLRPNILLMGFKSDWRKCTLNELDMYFNTVHKAFDIHLALCILRLKEGLDYSNYLTENYEDNSRTTNNLNAQAVADLIRSRRNSTESLYRDSNYGQISRASSASDISIDNTHQDQKSNLNPNESSSNIKINISKTSPSTPDQSRQDNLNEEVELPKEIINNYNKFQKKQPKGTIDVWWLYDDGGLTLLLPYIISTRHNWAGCQLRVFALANKQSEFQYEERSMASLLAKFRIDYSDLKIITDITKKPRDITRALFDSMIKDFVVCSEDADPDSVPITEAELLANNDKTNRHLRLRELLLEHSQEANLVVMTLPMPRKGVISAPLYMAWLEILTKDMPPFLLVRGNQTSVLTFYS